MAVHAVEPVAEPADAGLEEADAKTRELREHPAADDVHRRGHELEGVTDHVEEERVLVAVAAERGHARAEARVDGHGDVERFGFLPERIVGRIAETPAVERVGPYEHRLEAEVLHHAPHLADRLVDALDRHRRYGEEPARIGAAEVGHPIVVGAAGGRGHGGVADVAVEEPERRVEHRHVDAFLIHQREPRTRIERGARHVAPARAA